MNFKDLEMSAIRRLTNLQDAEIALMDDDRLRALRTACTTVLNLTPEARVRVHEYVKNRLAND